jgi:hypothetical protein
LINIAQSPGYSNLYKNSPQVLVNDNLLLGELCREDIFGICNFDDSNLKQRVSEIGMNPKEMLMVNKVTKLISDSYSLIKVQEEGIGPLFISLPDVDVNE